MAILGLVSTETYDSYRLKNIRRSVQHQYPNGAAVLTGLLSLMDEETTNDPSFSHWEDRFVTQRTLTASSGASKGPFMNSSGVVLSDPATITADTTYQVYVDDASQFRVGHVIKVGPLDLTSGTAEIQGVVSAVDTSTNYITFRAITTQANIKNGTTDENCDKYVLVIGSAFAQGRSGVSGEVAQVPVKFDNYTQIFRTPFRFTGTVLKAPLNYDESGPYKEKSKQHALQHMVEMEKAFLFGTKSTYVASGSADPATGTGLPITTTGGVLYYLRRWEAGDYGTVTATSDSDDDKRIIDNTGGTINEKTYHKYLERLFRVTNNTTNEKLVLCGSSFLLVLNELYKSKSVLNASLPLKETYGMNVVAHTTPFGTIYYKTHPLFSQHPEYRYCALFLDVNNLKYRPMTGRDTELLKHRQENDADYRKDEWFTEAGMELWFPESHMFLKNVQDYTP